MEGQRFASRSAVVPITTRFAAGSLLAIRRHVNETWAAHERPGLPAALRWTIAIVAPIVALIANKAIPNGLFPTPFLLSAVMITAHFGGVRAAVLAFLLSFGLLDYFYVPPYGTLDVDRESIAALVQFIVPALIGVWFIDKRKEVELLLARETAIAKRLQGEQTPADLGRSVVEYLAPELGAPIASFYEIDDGGVAHRRAGYAFDLDDAPETIAHGTGVIGQAVRENRMQIVATPPERPSPWTRVSTSSLKFRIELICLLSWNRVS